MIPLHFLPTRARAIVFIVIYLAWGLLFAYGTIRLALAHEWGYAAVCALFAGLCLLYMRKMSGALRPDPPEEITMPESETSRRPDRNRPIE